MKKEEAIEWLEVMKETAIFEQYEALKMAIEALSIEPHGEWIDKGDYAECSICGAHSGTQFDGVEPIPLKTNFCPNCGRYMGDTAQEKLILKGVNE